jgi:Fungal specific transcription factor domain
MSFLGLRGALQTPLQSTVISASTPGQPIAVFDTEENNWDFNTSEEMDISQWWTFGGEVGTTRTTGQLEDNHPQNSSRDDNFNLLDLQGHPDNYETPVIWDMRNKWFNTIQRNEEILRPPISTSGSQTGSSPRGPDVIDEEYRHGLTKALIRSFPEEDLLPSSDLFVSRLISKGHTTNSLKNICIRRYFECFNPIFPILHAATFQPTSDNGLLLISMASIGCLFLGSHAAVQRGRRIFESLNKAILTSVGHIAFDLCIS